MPSNIRGNIRILSWALYDLANQFFALNIISLYFVRWLVIVKHVPEIYYSIAFAVSVFFVAVLSPFLGAVSDVFRRHRLFLIVFTVMAVLFTMALGVTDGVPQALLFFALANLSCQLAAVFYNALMVHIAPPEKIGLISGLGRMFGYSGAAVSLFVVKPIVLKYGYQATFIPTGFLFLLFALPCMVLVRERDPRGIDGALVFRKDFLSGILRVLKGSWAVVARDKGLFPFFQSIFCSLAAVNVLILFMSTYATKVFKLDEVQIIHLIGFSIFFSIAGSLVSGWLSDRLGCRPCLMGVYGLWIFCFIAGAFVRNACFYYLIGAAVGLALGAIWVVIRAMAVRLVPREKIGEMFGLFNLVGYSSAIMGSLFWGGMLALTGFLGEWRYRLALISLSVFMSLGIFFLSKVPRGLIRNRV